MISTSFRRDAADALDASSQSCFVGSPRSMGRLRAPPAVTREVSSPRPVSAALFPVPSFMTASQQEDKEKDTNDDGDEGDDILETGNEFLEQVNNVLSDIVDGQKFLKETGRKKPKPTKRRSLLVCLAMGAMQPYLNEVEDKITSLRRTTSNSLAKTVRLVSQLSIGASRQLSGTFAKQLSFSKNDYEQLMPAAA